MAATPKVYVLCDANCRWESMTREQILTAITQAVSTGEIGDINTGFIQTIKTINGKPLKMFVGTQAEYGELSEDDKKDLFAIITDDTTKDGLLKAISDLQTDTSELRELFNGIIDGDHTVGKSGAVQIDVDNATSKNYTVMFSSGGNGEKTPMVSSGLLFNPSTGTLKAENFNGKAKDVVNGFKFIEKQCGILTADEETDIGAVPEGKSLADVISIQLMEYEPNEYDENEVGGLRGGGSGCVFNGSWQVIYKGFDLLGSTDWAINYVGGYLTETEIDGTKHIAIVPREHLCFNINGEKGTIGATSVLNIGRFLVRIIFG